MNQRIYISKLREHIGKKVFIAGWVHVRRDHGKLIFIDIRDATGKVQTIALPNNKEVHTIVETIRPEWVIEVIGKVNKRPDKMVNKEEENGDIEVELFSIKILNESKTPPFEITEDTFEVDEITRLKYRYLDLRTERMQRNLKIRSQFIQKCREYLFAKDFIEIETPLLTASTAE